MMKYAQRYFITEDNKNKPDATYTKIYVDIQYNTSI